MKRPESILHNHNSIPCYTGEEADGCAICIRNKVNFDWEEFLPSKWELKEILSHIDYDCFGKEGMTHGKRAMLQAEAISKRLVKVEEGKDENANN